MSSSPADDKAGVACPAAPPEEEVDVWWGAYSGWTMLPSFVACLGLTAVIAWGAWLLVPRDLLKMTFIGLAGVLWLGQLVRWLYRVFGYNYRLTTNRLFLGRGLLYAQALQVRSAAVAHVVLVKSGWDRLVKVGRIKIVLEDKAQPAVVLEGIRHPEPIAELLRSWAQKARERKEGGVTGSG
jgi:hypothetical protein